MPTRRKPAPDPELQPGFWGDEAIAPGEETSDPEPPQTPLAPTATPAPSAPLHASTPVAPPLSRPTPPSTSVAAVSRPASYDRPTTPTRPQNPFGDALIARPLVRATAATPGARELGARLAQPIRVPARRAAAPAVPEGPRFLDASPHDRHVWRRLRALPPTGSLAEELTRTLPAGEGLLGDLFTLLYRADLRWLETPPAGAASIHGPILEGLLASPGIGRIRSGVRGDDRLALLAVDAIARRIAERLADPEVHEHLAAEQVYEEERSTLAREISRIEELILARAKKRPPRPGDGAEEPETMAMGERKALLERKSAQVGELDRAHRGNYERVRAEAAVRAAIASADLSGISSDGARELREWPRALAAWGDDPASPAALDAAASLGLFRRLAADPGLRAATELLGRMRLKGAGFHRSRTPAAPLQISGHESGTDLGRLVPSEMVWLADPAAETEFLRRYGESELLLLRIEERGEPTRGPLVVCVDESSSMEGELAHHAKAIALALIGIANEDRRAAALVRFSGAGSLETVHFAPDRPDPTSTARILAELLGGGTDFDGPLVEGIRLIREDVRYGSADLVMITDGDGRVHPDTAAAINAARAECGLRLWAICAGVGDAAFREIADRSWPFARLLEGGEALLGDLVEATHRGIPGASVPHATTVPGLTEPPLAPRPL